MHYQKAVNISFLIMLLLILSCTYANAAELNKTSIAADKNSVSKDVYETDYENANEINFFIEDIVLDVNKNINSKFKIFNRGGSLDVGLSPDTGVNLLRFSHKGADLFISPEGVKRVTGKVDKNSIKYEEIYPYTDIRYTVRQNSLKEDIILHKYTGKNSFTFNFEAHNTLYNKTPDGIVLFYEPETKELLFIMTKPFAMDKKGDRCDDVSFEISSDGKLVVSIDELWLKQASYPVVIDPTLYLASGSLKRSSIAYNLNGNQVEVNQPRYEMADYDQGILIEEGTTQYLVNADFNSLTNWSYATGMVLTDSYYGAAKIVRASANNGTTRTNINQRVEPAAEGEVWTLQCDYRKIGEVEKVQSRIQFLDANNTVINYKNVDFTNQLTDGFKTFSVTATAPAGTARIRAYLGLDSSQRTNNEFEICKPMLSKKSYATTWHAMGKRSVEILTIPAACMFNKGDWSVDLKYMPVDDLNDGNTEYLLRIYIDSNNYYQLYTTSGTTQLRASIRSGGVTFNSPLGPVIEKNQNYYITLTGDGNQMKLFVNGVEYDPGTAYLEPAGPLPENIYIGSTNSGSAQCNGIISELRISNLPRSLEEHQEGYHSGQPLPFDVNTTCKMIFDGDLEIVSYIASSPDTNSFKRSSVAYNLNGNQVEVNQPRYEMADYDQGILIEEGTTQYLVNANFNSLTNWSYATGMVLTNSYCGAARIVRASANNGTTRTNINQRVEPAAEGEVWTLQCDYRKIGDVQVVRSMIQFLDANNTVINYGNVNFSNQLTNEFKTYSVTATAPAGTAKVRAYLGYDGGQRTNNEFEICKPMLSKKSYATTWHASGKRSPEILAIPTVGIINKGDWSVDLKYLPVDDLNDGNTEYLLRIYIDSNNYYQLYTTSGTTQLMASIRSGGVTFNSSLGPVIEKDQNYYITLTIDGSQMKLFVNGVEYDPGTAYLEPIGPLPESIYVGSTNSGSAQCNGIISDLRISDLPRTLAEHQAVYQSNQPFPFDADTTLKLSFDNTLDAYVSVINYYYDSLNRLNTIVTPKKTIIYQYDENGNLIRRAINQ